MGPMSERFEMRLDEEMLTRVDTWRDKQGDAPTRAEAMRRLLELGLAKSGDEAVTFTDGEKLLFFMMRDLYKHLKVQGEVNPDFISSMILGGHYWAAKWDLQHTFSNYHDDPRDVRFVVDVLDMWDFMESGYEKLSKKDKERVEKEAGPFGKHVRFPGFDGNNEVAHVGIARFLIEDMNRWQRFKGRELNSHSRTLTRYSRMLNVFEPIRPTLVGVGLTADQLIQLLKLN